MKIVSRCNLSCDYCYMYEMGDNTWLRQPKRMSADTVKATAWRIDQHVNTHALGSVQVVLHGGEPLMAGMEYLEETATVLRGVIRAQVDLRVQTNGTLLTNTMIDALSRHKIRVGVSLDGAAADNDRHRRYANGNGSHAVVAQSLRRLQMRAPEIFSGILCTIDLKNDPVETYEAIQEFSPPAIDLLLPHGNWTTPPPGRDPSADDAPYGEWLAAVFDYWYKAAPPISRVRMFSEILHLMFGGQSSVETVGLAPVALIVIDADGTMEQVDALRSSFDGAAETGFNVQSHGFDAVLRHPAIVARQLGFSGLSPTCQKCPLHQVCGGGFYAHRYLAGKGFLNPSVYCRDLEYLISHIHRRVSSDFTRLGITSKGPS